MAEFCLTCWNQLNGTHYTEADLVIDHEELDICEGCGKWMPCIVKERGFMGRLVWKITHKRQLKE